MPTTFADLVSQCSQQLKGYTRNQEQIAWLSQPMTNTDTTFQVEPTVAQQVSRGLVEIEDELLLVSRVDTNSGITTVAAGVNGRGREGTEPAAHPVNAIITMDPDYPMKRIKEQINYTIQASYPDLFVFDSYEFTKVAARYEYPMPVEMDDVVRVTVSTIGPSKVWFAAQSWRFSPQASMQPGDGSPTGKSLQIFDQIVPGRTIKVEFYKKPNDLVGDMDLFTNTGYDERMADMIMYGAVARMLGGVESARLQQKAVESTERAPLVPTGASTQAAQYYWSLYYRRLDEERDRLRNLFPIYSQFNGG